jgi:hypothetical protein
MEKQLQEVLRTCLAQYPKVVGGVSVCVLDGPRDVLCAATSGWADSTDKIEVKYVSNAIYMLICFVCVCVCVCACVRMAREGMGYGECSFILIFDYTDDARHIRATLFDE